MTRTNIWGNILLMHLFFKMPDTKRWTKWRQISSVSQLTSHKRSHSYLNMQSIYLCNIPKWCTFNYLLRIAIVFDKRPNRYYSPTFGIVLFALASSTTRHLEFSARTILTAFAGDTQLVYHCVTSGNGGTVKDTGSKCVKPIFQPISNNVSSIFKWVSFSTAVNHHALQPWRIDPFDSNKACSTLEHSYSPMVS